MRWYKRASRASLDMSVPRKMIENMVARAIPGMEEQERLSRTPLNVDEYAHRADQAMSGMDEELRAPLAPMVSGAIDGARSGNREPLSDLLDHMIGNMRKRWGEFRELYKALTALDDHMSSSGEVSARQMAEEYRQGLESELSRGEQQALELLSRIEGFLDTVGSDASVVLEMSPGENYETRLPVFHPMDFSLKMTFPGSEALEPSMTVFTDEDKGMMVDDVLSWGDGDFFSNNREMTDYFGLVEFLRTGKMPEQKKGFVRLYRGMSPKEYDAWQSGGTIPAGKYFSSSPTAEYAQDISGEFPELFSFLVDRGVVYETSHGEYQTSGEARLDGKRIVPAR